MEAPVVRRAQEIVLGHEKRSPVGVVLTLTVLALGITQWVSVARYAVFAGLVLVLNVASAFCAHRCLDRLGSGTDSTSLMMLGRWSQAQMVMSGLGGIVWGAGCHIMGFSSDAAPTAILAIFQGALITITTITMGSDRRRYLAFGLPMVVGSVVANVLFAHRLNLVVAFGTVVFFVFLAGLQGELHRTYVDNLVLTIRNESLVNELQVANERLQHDNSELQHQVTTDALTRVNNRAGWEQAVEAAFGDGEGGQGIAILIVDVDDFKEVNDSFGHDVGDRVLVSLAQRLRASVKEHDTVARLGGDEFAVLLTHIVSDEDLAAIQQRVSLHLAHSFVHQGFSTTVTISVGGARRFEGESPSDVLVRADEALYDEKRRRKWSIDSPHPVRMVAGR
jgi:diguanylate cyclase (GGDEF)-like protein